MINPDILRVMADLYTFTSGDLDDALGVPAGTMGGMLSGWVRAGYVVRFKFKKTYLYALSMRGERLAAKLPPVDPDERCLMLSFEGICPDARIASGCCPDWKTTDMKLIRLPDSDMFMAWECPYCECRFPVAVHNPH